MLNSETKLNWKEKKQQQKRNNNSNQTSQTAFIVKSGSDLSPGSNVGYYRKFSARRTTVI